MSSHQKKRPNPALQRTGLPSAALPPAANLPSTRCARLGAAELCRWAGAQHMVRAEAFSADLRSGAAAVHQAKAQAHSETGVGSNQAISLPVFGQESVVVVGKTRHVERGGFGVARAGPNCAFKPTVPPSAGLPSVRYAHVGAA
jgi:hypothetical protein